MTEPSASELEVLAESSRLLTSPLDLAEVLDRLADIARARLAVDMVRIWLLDDSGGTLRLRAQKGALRSDLGATKQLSARSSLAGWVFTHREPLVLADVQADPRLENRRWFEAEGFVSFLCVPIVLEDGVIGILAAMTHARREFSGADVALAEALTVSAAVAVRNAGLYAEALARLAAIAMENARLVTNLRRALDELKETQETLVRGATLRAVGELAAGVAHHLNNLMAVVLGRSQLLLLKNPPPDMAMGLRTIERAALAAADTVRRIQAFSRADHDAEAGDLDLNRAVRESIDFTRSRWQDEARVRGTLIDLVFEPGRLPPVSGRSPEIREVLTNLILNAVDALPAGGRVLIRTWSEPGRALVSISDSGPGMPDEVKDRAFEPFFTTRGVKRMGLGLAVAYGLVRSHGGEISLASEEGKGTTVTFWLPEAGVREAAPAPEAVGPERRGRILVIDDEPDVRELLADVLGSRGHEVTGSGSGRDGLARFERGQYDLVITDLGMPDLNGWGVARAIKAARAHVPVLLLTGWGAEAEAGRDGRVDGVIMKPFDVMNLAAVVSAALAPRPEA